MTRDDKTTDRDHVAGTALPTITDEFMRARIIRAQPYTAVLLRKTAAFDPPRAGYSAGCPSCSAIADGFDGFASTSPATTS